MSFENSVSELLEEFLRSLKNLVLIDPRSFKETSRDKNSFKKMFFSVSLERKSHQVQGYCEVSSIKLPNSTGVTAFGTADGTSVWLDTYNE